MFKQIVHLVFIAALIAALTITGCASLKQEEHVSLSEGLTYKLTPPPKDLVGKSQTHLLEFEYNKQNSAQRSLQQSSNAPIKHKRRLIAQVEYGVDSISLAAMSSAGLPLFDFSWHIGKPIKVNQYVPLPNLNINHVIADLQWINWPIGILRSSVTSSAGSGIGSLSQDDVSVIQIDKEPSLQKNWLRTVKHNGKLILTVEKHKNDYQLQHIIRNYTIKVTNLGKDTM